jgi:hypothetical protein
MLAQGPLGPEPIPHPLVGIGLDLLGRKVHHNGLDRFAAGTVWVTRSSRTGPPTPAPGWLGDRLAAERGA